MTQSFDDALNKHKSILSESLVNFDEGKRIRKIMLEIDSNLADYEYYFQSGQQSKQDEVDELQKRINDCIKAMDDSICDIDCGTIYGILTGDQS